MARFLAVLAVMSGYVLGTGALIASLGLPAGWAATASVVAGLVGLPVALLAIEASLMIVRRWPE